MTSSGVMLEKAVVNDRRSGRSREFAGASVVATGEDFEPGDPLAADDVVEDEPPGREVESFADGSLLEQALVISAVAAHSATPVLLMGIVLHVWRHFGGSQRAARGITGG
ncbi:hypothetical protein EEW87_17355 [Janibacter melonis]|uniref:Uncharacterized protein n=1 Tax=Janibacter melonis TaxID=262209 RepID=A0A650GE42_9MICO|nr:hypothetical protein [Janibacter melonis]QGX08688.1 hypothetical protein EEW87_17355 [Janibacter melonis]